MRVARSAEILAQRHGLDTAKARLAGMLHDLARLYPLERLLEECRDRHIAIGAFERRNPIVLHAPLGAALAHEEYGIDDPEVLGAIAKHTLGDASMSPLDCVVYLADGLEPGRDFSGRAELWQLAMKDLAAAMSATIASSLNDCSRKGLEPAPQTLACLAAFNRLLGAEPSLN